MHTTQTPKGLKLTLTKDDFDLEFFTAGGNGGQNVQKTATACRCTHRPSGSVGISRDERSQLQNKKLAFQRCTGTDKFRFWCKMELARIEERMSGRIPIEQQVEQEMAPGNLFVETQDSRGRWVPAN